VQQQSADMELTMAATGTALQALEHQPPSIYAEQLERLVSHELPRFYRQAYRQLDNLQDAEDAVQDALVSAYKNLSQFRGTAQLSTWLMTIVMNAARMQRRRRRPTTFFEQQIAPGEDSVMLLEAYQSDRPDPEELCARSEFRCLLGKAIQRLSPASRKVVRYYVDGRTTAEVAAALGIPEGTIKGQLSRARVKLARMLRRDLGLRIPATRTKKPRVSQ